MQMDYYAGEDLLEIWLAPEAVLDRSFHAADFTAVVGKEGALLSVIIRNARSFTAQLSAQSLAPPPSSGKVWSDADSSMISAYAYDEEKQILEVAFNRSGVYRYFDVPRRVFDGLHAAESKGSYLHSMVLNRYSYYSKR